MWWFRIKPGNGRGNPYNRIRNGPEHAQRSGPFRVSETIQNQKGHAMASIIYAHDGTLTYMSSCKLCRATVTIENVPATGYANWRKGISIQEAFPSLTADEREFFLSQICGPCYDSEFSVKE